jgi:hypothetical protein
VDILRRPFSATSRHTTCFVQVREILEFKLRVSHGNKPKSDTSKGGYVLINDLRTGNRTDLIIIVYVPNPPGAFEFFIATRGELADAEPEVNTNPTSGIVYKRFTPGISYRTFEQFKENWDLLRKRSLPVLAAHHDPEGDPD